MAKNELKTLIRVHKFELDEKQRKLGALLRFEQALLNRKVLLAERFKQEEEAANVSPVAALTFGAYVDWHVEENKRVDRALEDNRQEIILMREEIMEAYQELKTLEITQENREKRELAELERKMNAILDEIGLTLYRRRKAEESADEPDGAAQSSV
ncbi:MAG: flagellar export protein FliJ [Alphaproteobacteria bacterium]|nr:flagellar export protein FliJ [Alphaproteobacteria bacterium]